MDVTISGSGINSNAEAQVDASTAALHTVMRPTEWVQGAVIGGHYSAGAMTQLMAAAIASSAQVFQVRWADPVKIFSLKKLTVMCTTATGFAATGLSVPLELVIGHGSTANGSGGSAAGVTSISNRMRNVMAASAFVTSGEIRVATTAALVAATGQTLEPVPVSGCQGPNQLTNTQSPQMILFENRDFGTHSLCLASGDTMAVRTSSNNTPGVTGTWYAYFTMEWLEVVNF